MIIPTSRTVRIVRYGFAAALALTFLPLNVWAKPELVFFTWSEYIDPEVVSEFEERFDAKIRFSYFESDDTRTDILVANEGTGFDLALVAGLDIQKYAKRNWLAPLGQTSVPNLEHIDPRWRDAFPGAREYAVPYFWGTTGIAYRADLVPEPITSWKQLLQPPEALRGKIVMNNYSRDVIGVALKALGYSLNSSDRSQLKQAEELLQAQRPYVSSYSYVSLSEESALVSGDVWLSMIYSGDALMVKEHNEDIAYVLPEEGANLWVDYIAVMQSSKNKELAREFINFLNEPKIAARLAEFVYYATPNKAAEQHLPADYFADPVIFPPADQLAHSEFYKPLAARAKKFTNSIMVNLLNNEHAAASP
jgi:spermidine/putrescine transport system substrate-binding protein